MGLFHFLFKKSEETQETQEIQKETIQDTSKNKQEDSSHTQCEKVAIASRQFFEKGDRGSANFTALSLFLLLENNAFNISEVKDYSSVALALGALLEGDNFETVSRSVGTLMEDEILDNDTIIKAVGITYYFLCKAINECEMPDPYLYVYRFSTVWEYNKVFYHLLAHAEGEEFNFSPFDIMSQVSTMTYNHHMAGMQMADALTEPKVLQLDPALRNIFYETYEQYRNTPSEQIISLGNQYHEQVYTYLADKISRDDLDF